MIISGIGRLGQDPKMSYTPKGTAQTNLNLAVKCGYGEREQTVWCSLVSWGSQAELLNNQLSKGMRINVTAEMSGLRTYEKKDGSTGVSLDGKIIAFEFIDYAGKADKETEAQESEYEF